MTTNRQKLKIIETTVRELWSLHDVPRPIAFDGSRATIEDEMDIARLFSGRRFDKVDRESSYFEGSFALSPMLGSSKLYYLGTYLLHYCDYAKGTQIGEEDDEYQDGFGLPDHDFWGMQLYEALPLVWEMELKDSLKDILAEIILDISNAGEFRHAFPSVIAKFARVAEIVRQ